ncbi:MAG TPA: LLM class flavin-dependent oxidoreductase [Solirubrobacteraceae bacterium]|jgi:probable F420-dependent oxidoreductase
MKVRFAVAPGAGAPETDLETFADVLETSGFDGVWLSDLPAGPLVDPLIGLALIAGRSRRLKLGANLVPLGRNPFLLAKALAHLDQLSRGRLLLSFVTGVGQPDEAQVLGTDGANRGVVLEEIIALLRSWWAGDTVDHESARWSFASLMAPVRPVQQPLEIWLGGRGPKALDRVGRIADGWLGAALTPEEAVVACEQIRDSAVRAGREVDPEHFGLSIAYAREAPDPLLLETMRKRRDDIDPLELLPVGAPALRLLLERHIDAGLSKFVVRPAGPVSSWAEEIDWLAAAILDLQS